MASGPRRPGFYLGVLVTGFVLGGFLNALVKAVMPDSVARQVFTFTASASAGPVSLNLLVFLILAGYLAFYTLARLVSTLAAIPARVRAYREERTRTRYRQSLSDALLAFFQGRYASAEKSAGSRETASTSACFSTAQ